MVDIRSSFEYLLFRGYRTRSDKSYDEERLGWGAEHSLERRRKSVRIGRSRKSTILLLFLDFMVVWLLIHHLEPLITLLRRNEELFKPQVTLSGFEDGSNLESKNESNNIPRILHQTTATDTIPDKWVESQRSCMKAYGDFEYKVSLYTNYTRYMLRGFSYLPPRTQHLFNLDLTI